MGGHGTKPWLGLGGIANIICNVLLTMTKCFLCIMIRAEQSQLVLPFLHDQQTAVAGKRSQPGVQMLVVLLSCCGCPLCQVFWGIRLKRLLQYFNLFPLCAYHASIIQKWALQTSEMQVPGACSVPLQQGVIYVSLCGGYWCDFSVFFFCNIQEMGRVFTNWFCPPPAYEEELSDTGG